MDRAGRADGQLLIYQPVYLYLCDIRKQGKEIEYGKDLSF